MLTSTTQSKKGGADFGSASMSEYLLGSRKMKPFPVAMSLVARYNTKTHYYLYILIIPLCRFIRYCCYAMHLLWSSAYLQICTLVSRSILLILYIFLHKCRHQPVIYRVLRCLAHQPKSTVSAHSIGWYWCPLCWWGLPYPTFIFRYSQRWVLPAHMRYDNNDMLLFQQIH